MIRVQALMGVAPAVGAFARVANTVWTVPHPVGAVKSGADLDAEHRLSARLRWGRVGACLVLLVLLVLLGYVVQGLVAPLVLIVFVVLVAEFGLLVHRGVPSRPRSCW